LSVCFSSGNPKKVGEFVLTNNNQLKKTINFSVSEVLTPLLPTTAQAMPLRSCGSIWKRLGVALFYCDIIVTQESNISQ
jgi:hypothetical protein